MNVWILELWSLKKLIHIQSQTAMDYSIHLAFCTRILFWFSFVYLFASLFCFACFCSFVLFCFHPTSHTLLPGLPVYMVGNSVPGLCRKQPPNWPSLHKKKNHNRTCGISKQVKCRKEKNHMHQSKQTKRRFIKKKTKKKNTCFCHITLNSFSIFLGTNKTLSAALLKLKLKTCGATRKPKFPRTGRDRTETSPGSGHVLENIFWLGQIGDKDFGPVRVRVFFTGVWSIFPASFLVIFTRLL